MRFSSFAIGSFLLGVSMTAPSSVTGFVVPSSATTKIHHSSSSSSLFMSTPEEQRAAVLSEYLAKAHEEKLKAIKAAEDKKNGEIQALRMQLAEAQKLEGMAAAQANPPPPAESPSALSEYMAKAHEEKLRAIKAAEDTKNAEIQALKAQLAQAQQGIPETPPPPASDVAPIVDPNLESLSQEQLIAAVRQYQNWMANYIVNAQEQKQKAVQEVLDAVEEKYKEAVAAAPAPAVTEPVAAEPVATEPVASVAEEPVAAEPVVPEPVAPEPNVIPAMNDITETPAQQLYAQRTETVAAAAAAGKSRWGTKESQKAQEAIFAALKQEPEVPPPVEEAPAVEEAPTVNGMDPSVVPKTVIYGKRNQRLAAAGAAGKARWGDLELQRAYYNTQQQPPVSPPPVTFLDAAPEQPVDSPEVMASKVEEADHGLRNDGGVGGLTLSERIAMGAEAAQTAQVATDLYEKRNLRVAAEAAAGKARWGDMEVQMANYNTQQQPPVPAPPVTLLEAAPEQAPESPPVMAAKVEEADHGLRNDGGVGGLTLAERVAMGAEAAETAQVEVNDALYQKRNMRVVAAAAAGKSRWGAWEVQMAQAQLSASTTTPTSEAEAVKEADHGLRADGGVSGPSLLDRVNLGASMMGQ
ncbi:expressed unknown protein [Seminavis robusta]|uniref:Uncharacterized protein n=1 Tax=Seminavis robusta TaxID=568900 RepID=A0A9N8DRR9_9STRA|nr:expressed unknown protein [Seminavis robusta]|eukprot:Sro306_g112980.1 n/a (637) ;mRNA; f:31967-33877